MKTCGLFKVFFLGLVTLFLFVGCASELSSPTEADHSLLSETQRDESSGLGDLPPIYASPLNAQLVFAQSVEGGALIVGLDGAARVEQGVNEICAQNLSRTSEVFCDFELGPDGSFKGFLFGAELEDEIEMWTNGPGFEIAGLGSPNTTHETVFSWWPPFPMNIQALQVSPLGLFVGDRYGLYRILPEDLSKPLEEMPLPLRYTREHELSDQSIQTLLTLDAHTQDLWVGTQNGLDRVQFHSSQEPEVHNFLQGESISLLREDGFGGFWASSNQKLFHVEFLGETPLIKSYSQKRSVLAMEADGSSKAWVGTDEGLVHFQKDLETLTVFPEVITVLKNDTSQGLWVGTKKGLYRYFQNGKIHDYTKHHVLLGQWIYDIDVIDEDSLYVGTSNGLVEVHLLGGDELEVNVLANDEESVPLPSNRITALAHGVDRGLWIGTRAGMAFQEASQAQNVKNYVPSEGLLGGEIRLLQQGASQDLFVQTEGGLSRLAFSSDEGVAFENFTEKKDAFFASPVTAVGIISDEEVWIGTQNEGLAKLSFLSGGSTELTKVADKGGSCALPSKNISSLTISPSGELWISSERKLYRQVAGPVDAACFENVPFPAGVSEDVIIKMAFDKAGDLWIARNEGLLRMQKLENEYVFSSTLDYYPVLSLAIDANDVVWVGTSLGLMRILPEDEGLDIEEITVETSGGALLSNQINALAFSLDGKLWIGTEEGLNRLSSQGTKVQIESPLQDRNILPSSRVLSLSVNDSNQLFIGTSSGLVLLQADEASAR